MSPWSEVKVGYAPASKPTIYFIGVTTQQSSIMSVFPKWAEYLKLGDLDIKGIDFVPHSAPEQYCEVVKFIKDDPLSYGALVTTHKLDLFDACKHQFDFIDPYAKLMSEVSSISKRDGALRCHAKDPISSGLSIDGFLPTNHFKNTDAGLLCMGAGGSAIAITWYLLQEMRGADRPRKIVVTNRSRPRLDHIKHIHTQIRADIPITYILAEQPETNDQAMESMPEASVIINATGLGKDASGSPITINGVFPKNAIAWDLNYRGNLIFLDHAHNQHKSRNLQVEDGWTYFIHGWTQVISEVFDIEIPAFGDSFSQLSLIAHNCRKA